MPDLTSLLLSASLTLPHPWHPPGQAPETDAEYAARVATIAEAVAIEAQEARGAGLGASNLAFAVMTIMYNESRFALSVHNGDTLGDRGRARCLAQIHTSRLVPREEWMGLTGVDLESTRRCARAAMRLLGAQYRRCGLHKEVVSKVALAKAFAAYGSGNSCEVTTSSLRRADDWEELKARARRNVKKKPPPEKTADSRPST
jgi:hypothetical protein